ncbi:DEAH-box ATP-dependent RNA helicase prp22 [Phlyctochytrium bullatum]|nr:DEAH-box ATP-dependent RNA helicase prp22 [Phlyctochytrium bullatum]
MISANPEMAMKSKDKIKEQFIAKCFAEKNTANFPELWDAVLLSVTSMPDIWDFDGNLAKSFMGFLKNGCNGSGAISYPAMLPLMSKIPKERCVTELVEKFLEKVVDSFPLEDTQTAPVAPPEKTDRRSILFIDSYLKIVYADLEAVSAKVTFSAISKILETLLMLGPEKTANVPVSGILSIFLDDAVAAEPTALKDGTALLSGKGDTEGKSILGGAIQLAVVLVKSSLSLLEDASTLRVFLLLDVKRSDIIEGTWSLLRLIAATLDFAESSSNTKLDDLISKEDLNALLRKLRVLVDVEKLGTVSSETSRLILVIFSKLVKLGWNPDLNYARNQESLESQAASDVLGQSEFKLIRLLVDHVNRNLPFSFGVAWIILLNMLGSMTFNLKRLILSWMREQAGLTDRLFDYVLDLLAVGTSARPIDVSIWDFTSLDLLDFDHEIANAMHIFAAHLYLKCLRTIPGVARSYWVDCKSRQRVIAMESYTEKYFSANVTTSEMESLQDAKSTHSLEIDIKVSKIAGEVTGIYAVDDASVDIIFRFPACYPLKQVEVDSKSGGSGKTTQFPQYVHEHNPSLRIVVTQPRRIAAVSAATRVAEEMGTRLGGSLVGYSIRFESVRSADTKIVYMTDGTLLRAAAASDSTLSSLADVVILDEAHERSLETDVLFGLLRRACQNRPDLRLVVMSATLNVDKFSNFFNEAPVYVIPGRMFKVDIFYARKAKMASLKSTFVQKAVDAVMQVHKNEDEGDMFVNQLARTTNFVSRLVFLTGQQDIELTCRLLKQAEEELRSQDIRHYPKIRHLSLFPIYSALDTPEQRAVFSKARDGHRKVIVATNIAQTSVTITGIRYVIDSGFVKEKMFDPKTGVDALLVVPVSKAAATQRAGRAGRTAEGKVFRLYSKDAFEEFQEDTTPEIQRSSLLGTILQLKKIGIHDVIGFDFIDPPDRSLVITALKQLYYIGALDDEGKLTDTGHKMAEFPISPFLSKSLIAACETFGCGEELLTLAAMLSTEDPYLSPRGEDKKAKADLIHARFGHSSGDHLGLIRLFNAWQRADEDSEWCRDRYMRLRAMRSAKNVRIQLEDCTRKLGLRLDTCIKATNSERGRDKIKSLQRHSKVHAMVEADELPYEDRLDDFESVPILRSICAGYFINTAKRHPQLPYFYHYLSSSGLGGGDAGAAGSIESGGGGDAQSPMLSLHIHPSSCLARVSSGNMRGLDWVIYNDVQFVTRANLRVVSRIDFPWVADGLERVSKCPVESVTGVAVEKPAVEGGNPAKKRKMSKDAGGESEEIAEKDQSNGNGVPQEKADPADSAKERDAKIEAAKRRYLQRKRVR